MGDLSHSQVKPTVDITELLESVNASSSLNRSESDGCERSNGSHSSRDEEAHCNGNAVASSVTGSGNGIDEKEVEVMNNTASAANAGNHIPFLDDEAVPMRERLYSQNLSYVTLKDTEDGNTLSTLHERLQQCINMSLDRSG